jgi:hypothetical protein
MSPSWFGFTSFFSPSRSEEVLGRISRLGRARSMMYVFTYVRAAIIETREAEPTISKFAVLVVLSNSHNRQHHCKSTTMAGSTKEEQRPQQTATMHINKVGSLLLQPKTS